MEAQVWCEAKGIQVSDRILLYFQHAGRNCIGIEFEKSPPYGIPYIATCLLPCAENSSFRGALVWIREWGVWGEYVERVGLRVLEVLRLAHNERRSLLEAPAHLFEESELVDAQVCLTQALLIGFDAYVVPPVGDYFVFVSHDSYACFVCKTRVKCEELLQQMRAAKLEASENEAAYRFGWDG